MLDLVLAAREGNRTAMTKLIDALQPYIKQRVTKMVFPGDGRMETVSDVAQKISLAVWQGLRQFRGATEPEFWGWLNQVIAHRTADHFREQPMVPLPLGQAGTDSGGPPVEPRARGSTPSQRTRDGELAEIIRAALDKLKAEHKEVLQMAYLEGRTTAEIATLLGLKPNAVHARLYRAKKALEPHLPTHLHDAF